jgi:hypothetical protein
MPTSVTGAPPNSAWMPPPAASPTRVSATSHANPSARASSAPERSEEAAGLVFLAALGGKPRRADTEALGFAGRVGGDRDGVEVELDAYP